jgi:hypothetical protein
MPILQFCVIIFIVFIVFRFVEVFQIRKRVDRKRVILLAAEETSRISNESLILVKLVLKLLEVGSGSGSILKINLLFA